MKGDPFHQKVSYRLTEAAGKLQFPFGACTYLPLANDQGHCSHVKITIKRTTFSSKDSVNKKVICVDVPHINKHWVPLSHSRTADDHSLFYSIFMVSILEHHDELRISTTASFDRTYMRPELGFHYHKALIQNS